DLVLLANNCLSKDPALRLRLVDWGDFTLRELRGAALEAKDRIRKRRQVADATELDDAEGEQIRRTIRRAMIEIRAQLADMIRRECIASELFPPLEIRDVNDPEPQRGQFVVNF